MGLCSEMATFGQNVRWRHLQDGDMGLCSEMATLFGQKIDRQKIDRNRSLTQKSFVNLLRKYRHFQPLVLQHLRGSAPPKRPAGTRSRACWIFTPRHPALTKKDYRERVLGDFVGLFCSRYSFLFYKMLYTKFTLTTLYNNMHYINITLLFVFYLYHMKELIKFV